MSHDLERALADLADAAERSARHGILAQPALPFTLHRVVGRVRRRRAARAATAGAVALVVLAGGAGAVDYGLDHGWSNLPATPMPTVLTPTRNEFCGVSDEDLGPLVTAADTLELRNLTPATVPTGDPFTFLAQAVNVTDRTLAVGQDEDSADTVLLTQHGVVVGAGFVSSPVWDRSATVEPGSSLEWHAPAVVYDCAAHDDATRTGAGSYEMWLVSDLDVDGTSLRTAGGPWPITLSDDNPSPGPTAQPDPAVCGLSDEGLATLADPFVYDVPVGFTAPTPGITAVDAAPDLVATLSAKGEEAPQISQLLPYVVVERDHVVVGGGDLNWSPPDSTAQGEYGTFTLPEPLRACPPGVGADARALEPELLEPGTYGIWVVAELKFVGASEEVFAIGGPWELTLVEPTDPLAALATCGEPLGFTADTLPDAGGLTLTAQLPQAGWTTHALTPAWSGALGTDDGQTIIANVSTPLPVVFTDEAGVVVGRTFNGDMSVDLYQAGPDGNPTLLGGGEPVACRADSELATAAGDYTQIPPGTYWAWPVAVAVLKEVQPANGEAYSAPADPVVVVGAPSRVTFGG